MCHFLDEVGANPGRSGHRMSIEAARIVYAAREAIASFFGASDPLRVIFGLNITDGINLALHGLLKPGDHVITSSMEHNAVMRPLNDLQQQGVEFTQVACRSDGTLDPLQVEAAVQPNTRLIVLNQASNVCGTLLPIQEVGQIVRQNNLLYLVDTAQSAGAFPNRHGKGLYRPSGLYWTQISIRADGNGRVDHRRADQSRRPAPYAPGRNR